MTPAGTNLLLASADAAPAPAGVVTKSCRFNDGDSPSLSRTYTSSATWTFSVWVKRGELGATNNLLGTVVQLNSSDQLVTPNLTTTAVYRDVGAWYHICVSNSGLYVNGVQVTGTVSTSALSDAKVGDSFDGFLSDVHLIDGTALDATSFAEEDSNGQWVPKAYSGSYGTEGFHLDFKDSSDIGNDVSGEGNDFTATNLAATDIMLDNPSAGSNFCLLNALDISNGTLSEGNTKFTAAASGDFMQVRSTFAASTGKWYWEVTATTVSENEAWIAGILEINKANISTNWYTGGWDNAVNGNCYGVQDQDKKVTGGSQSSFTSGITDGSVVGIHLDLDSGTTTIAISVDGSDKGTMYSSLTAAEYSPALNLYGDPAAVSVADVNFGQGDPNGNNNYQDGNGKGNFKYEPDSGFLAWCTNTQSATIAKPAEHVNTVTYTGNSPSDNDIDTVGFQSDLTWIKSRSNVSNHSLCDSVRGATKELYPNLTSNEYTDTDGLKSWDGDGFTVGPDGETNNSGWTFVAWNWKKSATAGFDIITWTGNASDDSTQEVAHSLGVAPEFIIAKNRTNVDAASTGSWIVYHKDLTSGYNLLLNDTAGEYQPDSPLIENVDNNSVDFGNDSMSFTQAEYLNYESDTPPPPPDPTPADDYVAYLFASVAGYSSVGLFSGSASQFIYTSFRPAFILAKRSDSTGGNWLMFDDKREGYNVDNDDLMANSTAAEATTDHIDILSNGFKIRTSDADLNAGTVIYLAVAKNPFKYAVAR